MHKIYTVILLIALVAQNEGASQGKWSRPIRNTQSDYTRQRRQFLYGEWIPLTKPCPTCRPLVDPLDVGQRPDSTGLVPPRPPTVTRQIHGEGNFFGQDDSAVLSVPPPPPSLSRHPGANFQNLPFQGLPSFSSPLSISSQQIFPQSQPVQFVHQPFLPNQNLLVNPSQPILPVLPGSSSSSVFGSETHGGQFVRNEKLPNFDSNFGQQKFTENVILEQNVRGLGGGSSSVFSSKPTPFPKQQNFVQQNSQQAFSQQQTILKQSSPQAFSQQQTILKQNSPQTFTQHQQTVIHQQHSRPQQFQQHSTIKIDDSILTPPPQSVANGTAQNLVLPNLEKEEIQLLYVPVETLRQRGNLQQQYLLQQQQQQQQQHSHQIRLQQQHPQPQNVQFKNGVNSVRPSSTLRPTDPTPTPVSQANGHFVTENSLTGGQTLSSIKLSSSHPFSTASTPTTVFFQNLRSQPSPHSFVSATPITSTEPTFITPSPFTQKLVPVTPETTLPHLATVQNTIPFSTSDIPFVTTPKNILTEGGLSEEIITGKPQFDGSQKFSQPFAYQSFQQGNVHLQSFGQTFPETRPTSSSQYFHQQKREKQTNLHGKEIENQENIKSQKPSDSTPYPQQQQVQENELREQYLLKQRQQKDFETQRLIQQQQRQNDLEEQRILQKQRKQKELEDQKKKEHEQRRQKEIEQERILQQQRQNELEEQRRLQQQRQNELEEQSRLQRLRDAEEKRLSQQKQRQQDSRERQRWQQQQQYQQQQTSFDQNTQYQLLNQQQKEDDKQQYYQQRQQQQILQQVHQVQQQQQQQQQQDNKNVFTETDNANYIPQAEQESETENPQLVPHQPPLSVFYKGYGKTDHRISDVLRELRNSRAITVLDQYFEKMPKVFVGPAGLVPPNGYDKYELPYLSNIENRLNDNEKDKLPFFVAPLNFVPPSGYSKIPFPSPHVGSVVISSDSVPAATAKPREAESSSSEEEDEHVGSFPLVGPELPGLINGLETEKNTVRTTTPSLPQTTAQLRNRRPNSNLYRQRKPVSRTRSTTTTTTSTNRPETPEQKSDESDSGLRKPFNRFLKRRRQPVKSTTENTIPEYQTEKKPVQNRYYSSQSRKQFNDASSGVRKYGNQGLERTTSISQTDFESRPTPSTYKLTQVSKDRTTTLTEENDNSLQSEEEGPYPTGSAKTISQQIYRPNDLRQKEANSYTDDRASAKLEPKVDTSTVADNTFDVPQPTHFSQESEVDPTLGSVKPYQEKSVESVGYGTLQEGEDSQYVSPYPTSLKYFDPTETPLPLVSVQTFEPSQQSHVQPTTEFITIDDRYTAAFAEISKHHHIPGSHQTKSSEVRPNLELSVELQAPFSDSYSQEQQSQSYSSEELSKPPLPVQYSGEYSSSSGSSSNEYSGSVEDSKRTGFYPNPTVLGPYSSRYTENYIETTTNSFKVSPETSTTELTNYDDHQTTAGVTALNAQTLNYNQVSGDYSSQDYRTLTDGTQNQHSSKGTEDVLPTTLPIIPTEVTESSAILLPQTTTQENANDQRPIISDGTSTKLSNPSLVRVKTRVRGKQRGQVSYPQSTATVPFPLRSRQETKTNENESEEYLGKSDYQQTTSKYNFRGLKKPLRPTVETTTEKDPKSHIFTVKPLRRPTNPSTVSTKRVRRPTTPLPTEESSHENNAYTPKLEYPSSGVSNDVYYDQTNQSPGRLRYKKPYNSREQETESASTLKPTSQTYYEDSSNSRGEEYSTEEESRASESASHEHTETKWSSTESEVLSSTSESAEVKKGQDGKKAFDPDLEKKNGRRRVRVRVNKRPHENFETAESQNLRTVANVLVPVTPAYKPGDDANLQLAKNSEANYEAGQKSYGYRSREYFRKRFNLTLADINLGQQSDFLSTGEQSVKGAGEEGFQAGGGEVDGGKPLRGKFRGYVRKVIKHPVGRKEGEQKGEQTVGYNGESSSQQTGFNQTGRVPGTRHKTFVRYVKKNKVKFQEPEPQEKEESLTELTLNQDMQQQPDEKQQENTQSEQTTLALQSQEIDTEQKNHFTTVEYPETQPTEEPQTQTTTTTTTTASNSYVTESGESQESTEYTELRQTKEPEEQSTQPIDFIEITESTSVRPSQQPVVGGPWQQPGKGPTKLFPISSHPTKTSQETYPTSQTTEIYPLKSTEGRVVYKNKYFQTLRPVYSRAPNTGILRIRDPPSPSTTEQTAEKENAEKKIRKYKYGKGGSFGSGGSSSSITTSQSGSNADGKKETGEHQTIHENKNKNTYTYDVRKYTRGGSKTREGGFKQFTRNRYTGFGKTETSSSSPSLSSSTRDETNDQQDNNQETTHDDYESTTSYASTAEVESTTEQVKLTSSEEDTTTSQTISYSGEAGSISSSGSSSSSEEENDEFFTTEKTETTVDDKFDISTLLYGNSEPGRSHLTEGSTEVFTSTDPTSKELKTTTTNDANTQPDLYRFAKNSFSFDETEKFTGTKNRAYVRNITADILGLSAPETDQGNEIIVSSSGLKAIDSSATTTETTETEVTTSYEKTDEPVTDDVTETQTTDSVPTTVETVSVNANAIQAKTGAKKVIVTVSGGSVSDEENANAKVSKLLKTSTQTKVSHETEICYRGKCIRTKSENPDEDLKLLVDSAAF